MVKYDAASLSGPNASPMRRAPSRVSRRRARMRKLCGGLLLVACLGCAKATLGRQELQESLTRHYLDLRWGRIASAARYLRPDLQDEFVRDWEARTQQYALNEFDVTHIVDSPDGEGADVYIEVSLVDQNTLTLKRKKLVQKWIKTESGWQAAEPLDLD